MIALLVTAMGLRSTVAAAPTGHVAGCSEATGTVCVTANGKVSFEGNYVMCTRDINTLPPINTPCWQASGEGSGASALPLKGGAEILAHGLTDTCTWDPVPPIVDEEQNDDLAFPGVSCSVAEVDWFMASPQNRCAILQASAWNEIDNVSPPEAWMDCVI